MRARRVLLQDARGGDRHLRVTWHPRSGQFHVSTWHGDVCSGAVRLRAEDASEVIALLVGGMADALAPGGTTTTAPAVPARPRWRRWFDGRGVAARWRAARIRSRHRAA